MQHLKRNGYPDPSLGDKHIFLSSRRTVVSRVPYGAEKSLKTSSFHTDQFDLCFQSQMGRAINSFGGGGIEVLGRSWN